MLLKDISFPTPDENILYDEVLLHLAERGVGGEALRFWESDKLFIVLGKICKEEDDLKIDELKRNKILVLRRSSGGGTVVQGKGCLNYSLILSKESNLQLADLRKSYAIILAKVIDGLKSVNVEATFLPICDIALVKDQKKISGNAQKRAKKFILHHGTILYNFDLNVIEQYLKFPKDVPEYRKGRKHLDFVTNVSLSAVQIKAALCKSFSVTREESKITQEEANCLKDFLATKKVIVQL